MLRAVARLLELRREPLQLRAPTRALRKLELLRLNRSNRADFGLMRVLIAASMWHHPDIS